MNTLSICYQIVFEISFCNTFDTFKILCIFQVLVIGKFLQYGLKGGWCQPNTTLTIPMPNAKYCPA